MLHRVTLAVVVVFLALSAIAAAHAQAAPTLTVNPESGPCDATVEVRGAGFPPDTEVKLALGAPHSGEDQTTLATPRAGADGSFGVSITLGEIGCEAAAADIRFDDPGEPRDLVIWTRDTANPQRIAARTAYRYTNTVPGERPALPVSGSGASGASRGAPWATLATLLFGMGLVCAGVKRRRRAT